MTIKGLGNFEAFLTEPIEKEIPWGAWPQRDPISENYISIKDDFMLFKVYNKSPFSIPIAKSRMRRAIFRNLIS